MADLNEQQFARYSALEIPDATHEYTYTPLPASMERHAPGEYQPTLPGMENMLKGEQTHTSVFFKHRAQEDDEGWGDVKGSDWRPREKPSGVVDVDPKALHSHPSQDWVDDKELHTPHERNGRDLFHDRRPALENIKGERVIMDGHHRVARAMLKGASKISAREWKA